MDHLCPHCGSPADDSSAFCSNCGTPQIHFTRPQEPPPTVYAQSTTPGTPFPPVAPYQVESHPAPAAITLDGAVALRSALLAGSIGAVLSALPFGFVLGLPLAGFLAVLFYRRRSWRGAPSTAAGFRLGALSGLLAFAIFVIFTAVETFLLGAGSELRQMMIEAVHRAQIRNPDPQAQQVFQFFLTPQGMEVMMIAGLIFTCAAFVLLSGLGGTLAATLLRPKTPPD